MKLNHLDLQVSDVRSTASMFQELFGLRLTSKATSSAIAILTDEDGFVLVLQRMKRTDESYPEGFHLGFYVDSPSVVSDIRRHAAALELSASEVIVNNRGTMIYLRTNDDYVIEVNALPERVAD